MTVSGLRHSWLWVLLALLLVVVGATSALGGFEKAEEEQHVRELDAGERVTAGPFRIAVTEAQRVPDPDEPKELWHLRVAVEVVNTTDVFVIPSRLIDVLMTPSDAGLVLTEEGDLPYPDVRHRADGTLVDQLNPGMIYHVVFDWPQGPEWDGDEVTLGIDPLEFVEEDPWTLDNNRWRRTKEAAFEGTFPVEQR